MVDLIERNCKLKNLDVVADSLDGQSEDLTIETHRASDMDSDLDEIVVSEQKKSQSCIKQYLMNTLNSKALMFQLSMRIPLNIGQNLSSSY